MELPAPELKVDFTCDLEGDTYTGKAEIENISAVPALMIRLNVVRNHSGEQILPVFYEDNYISLLPGEKRTVDISFKAADTGGEKPDLKYEISL